MHLTIVAIGSRGDVQPCVALGVGLKQAGYQVRIAAYGIFADLVCQYGLKFSPVEGDPREALEAQAGQTWQRSGNNPMKFIRGIRNLATFKQFRKTLADIAQACRGTEAILCTPLGAAAYSVAEMMAVPGLGLLSQPFTRSREMPAFMAPALPLGGRYNWWTYILAEQVLWQMVRVPINQWRRESLNLKPLSLRGPFNRLYRK
jgi:sterol 3beta-glucosyltransferase